MGAHPTFRIYELFGDDGRLPRYVGMARGNEHPWQFIWKNRDRLPGRLATWFRSLAQPPIEKTWFGRHTRLNIATARRLLRFRIRQICEMATADPNEVPDFLAVEPVCHGGAAGRPVAIVGADGTVTQYGSLGEAARALEVSRPYISAMVAMARPDGAGRAAF
jgi:hypothetical protein